LRRREKGRREISSCDCGFWTGRASSHGFQYGFIFERKRRKRHVLTLVSVFGRTVVLLWDKEEEEGHERCGIYTRELGAFAADLAVHSLSDLAYRT